MRQLERYIVTTVARTIGIVMLIFISVLLLIALLRELDDLGVGNYDLPNILWVVLLGLPAQLYQFFPMASLMGCLLGLHLLASHSEVVVMRTAGFSQWQILLALLKLVSMLLIVAFLLGEGVATRAASYASYYKDMAQTNGQAIKTLHGVWLRDGDAFVHIDQALPDGNLQGVTLYYFDQERKLRRVQHAQRAVYLQDHWQLEQVQQSTLADDKVTSQQLVSLPWQVSINPKFLRLSQIKAKDMSLLQLNRYIHYRHANGLLHQEFSLVFWQRLLQPWAILVMTLVALPFAFGQLRTTSMGARLFIGICLGFVFFIFNQFIGPMSVVYQIPPLLAAIIPVLLFAGLGLLLFWRMAR